MSEKPRKMFDIEIDEVTLCKSPANRRKFFITKQEEPMKEFIEALKKFMADDEDKVDEALTKDEIAKVEKLSDEDVKELKGALDELSNYDLKNIPNDGLTAIRTLAKKASFGQSPAKAKEIDFMSEIMDVTKAGARFSKATVEQLKKVRDMIIKLIGDRENAVSKKNKDLSDEVKAELVELERLRTEDKERIEKEQKEKDEAAEERIKKLEERLNKKDEEIETLQEQKGVKKSIDGPDDEEKKEKKKGADDEVDKFPSFPIPVVGD